MGERRLKQKLGFDYVVVFLFHTTIARCYTYSLIGFCEFSHTLHLLMCM